MTCVITEPHLLMTPAFSDPVAILPPLPPDDNGEWLPERPGEGHGWAGGYKAPCITAIVAASIGMALTLLVLAG